MISLTVHLDVDPARIDEFQEAMAAHAAASRAEPGCRGFQLHRRLDRPASFVLWEVYEDLAALTAHHASPHFARWKQRSAGGLVLSKESVRSEVVD